MKIMITGNLGYIGPSVVLQLRKSYPNAFLIGVDIGLFAHCLTGAIYQPESLLDTQIYKDVRDLSQEDFEGIDAVIHLAAISNDPMGKTFERITDEVNHVSSINIAKCAKKAGVKSYIFASSCSVYGEASDSPKKETDKLNPLTAYAKSKIDTELDIESLASDKFIITCLRFATACGFTTRTRLDLVLNDFVASAITNGLIDILSDGSPWRPLIHVSDMARAIDWAVSRDAKSGGNILIVNAGCDEWNYQVLDLAMAVKKEIPNAEIRVNENAVPDRRSYQVDFSKYKELAQNYQPLVTLPDAINGLKDGLLSMNFIDVDFRHSNFIRLNTLTEHIDSDRVTSNLKWKAFLT
jgi:nucleoside-diphosphate-sugar epimerase